MTLCTETHMITGLPECQTESGGSQHRQLRFHCTNTGKVSLINRVGHILLYWKLLNLIENPLHNLDKPVCNTFGRYFTSSIALNYVYTSPIIFLSLFTTHWLQKTPTWHYYTSAIPISSHFELLILKTQEKATSNTMITTRYKQLNKILCIKSSFTHLINF